MGRLLTLIRRLLRAELAVFGLVGAVCLLGDIIFFNLFAFEARMSPLLAKSASMVITGTIAFFGHRHLTFRGRAGGRYRREVTVFVAVTLATVVLSLLPLYVVRHVLGSTSVLWLNVANLLGITLGTAARYIAYRGLVWSGDPVSAAPSAGGALVVDDGAARGDLRSLRPLEVEHELIRE